MIVPGHPQDEIPTGDPVEHPPHYNSHPSGVEAIQVTEHFNYCMGNAIKYIWRADYKGKPIQDLEKAKWYINREIQRRKRLEATTDGGNPLTEKDDTILKSVREDILQLDKFGSGDAHQIARRYRIDQFHVVQQAWDLVEDGLLDYRADGLFHRVN